MPIPLAAQQPPQASQLATNPTYVKWDDGTLFDGYVWLGLRLPDCSCHEFPYLWAAYRLQRLPQFIRVPVVNGQIDQSTQCFYTNQINPPGMEYVAYWFSQDNVLVAPAANTATPFTVLTATTTLVVPTLAVPSPGTSPTPDTQCSCPDDAVMARVVWQDTGA